MTELLTVAVRSAQVLVWLIRLAAYGLVSLALFARDLYRAYLNIRADNLSSYVIQSDDTPTTGARNDVTTHTAVRRSNHRTTRPTVLASATPTPRERIGVPQHH